MNEEHHFTSMLGDGLVADELRTGDASFKPKCGTWCTNPMTNSAANIFPKKHFRDITRKEELHDCGTLFYSLLQPC